jgi:hypothetical protein
MFKNWIAVLQNDSFVILWQSYRLPVTFQYWVVQQVLLAVTYCRAIRPLRLPRSRQIVTSR